MMTEKTIRSLISELCAELDLRRLGKVVLPTVMGAGLALAGCSDRAAPTDGLVGHPEMGYAVPDAFYRDQPTVKPDSPVAQPDMGYGVPDLIKKMDQALKTDAGKKIDGAVAPPYMAPDVK